MKWQRVYPMGYQYQTLITNERKQSLMSFSRDSHQPWRFAFPYETSPCYFPLALGSAQMLHNSMIQRHSTKTTSMTHDIHLGVKKFAPNKTNVARMQTWLVVVVVQSKQLLYGQITVLMTIITVSNNNCLNLQKKTSLLLLYCQHEGYKLLFGSLKKVFSLFKFLCNNFTYFIMSIHC